MKLVYNGWFGHTHTVDLLLSIFVSSHALIIFSFFLINYKANLEKIWFDAPLVAVGFLSERRHMKFIYLKLQNANARPVILR